MLTGQPGPGNSSAEDFLLEDCVKLLDRGNQERPSSGCYPPSGAHHKPTQKNVTLPEVVLREGGKERRKLGVFLSLHEDKLQKNYKG